MNPQAIFYLLPLALLTSSCSSYLTEPSAVSAYSIPATNGSSSSRAKQPARILIKSGRMSLETSDVEATSTEAEAIIQKHKGYLENVDRSANHDGDAASARLELRIPSASLELVMTDLGQLGKVTSHNISVDDVTDQWIDLQAKLSNTRALRDRLRKLLQQAKTVEDTLKVEKELTRVQIELDALEGKMKKLSKHVSYSKLSLSISQKSILGPLGVVTKGSWWGVKKLFVIQ